jgi:hypothetical protein
VRNQQAKRQEVRTALNGPAWINLQHFLKLWESLAGREARCRRLTILLSKMVRVVCRAAS